jgi:hypothetical protein
MNRFCLHGLTLLRSGALAAAMAAFLGSASASLAADSSAHSESAAPAESASEDATEAGSNGIDLGEFRIRAYYPAESQKSTVSFTLYATIQGDKLARSQHLIEHRQHKMRNQIIIATRLVPLVDFNDPELTSFRRRILVQLRRALPELSIDNVYISDFELTVEQI